MRDDHKTWRRHQAGHRPGKGDPLAAPPGGREHLSDLVRHLARPAEGPPDALPPHGPVPCLRGRAERAREVERAEGDIVIPTGIYTCSDVLVDGGAVLFNFARPELGLYLPGPSRADFFRICPADPAEVVGLLSRCKAARETVWVGLAWEGCPPESSALPREGPGGQYVAVRTLIVPALSVRLAGG